MGESQAWKKIVRLQAKRCHHIMKNREVHEARLAKCGAAQHEKQELVKAKSELIFKKHQAADVNAAESKLIRRWEAKKQAMERVLRTDLAWEKIDDVAIA